MLDRGLVLPHRIASSAAAQPDRVFLQHVDGASRTYGQLHDAASRWAGALGGLGVGPGDTVLSMLPTGFDAVESWLGMAWRRAIEVPVNTAYRGRMLSYLVDDSKAEVVVVAARYLDRLADVAGELRGRLRTVVVLEADGADLPALPFEVLRGEDLVGAAAPASDLPGPEYHDVACILYTSGTTGPSKGVLVPWAQLHASVTGMLPDLGPDDVYYSPFPLFHVSGKGAVYFEALRNGKVVIRESFDTGSFWKDVVAHGVTTTLLLESMATFVWRQPERPDDADTCCATC